MDMIVTKPTDLKKFGKRLGQLREAAGLTQEQLAESSGVAYSTITSIEHGQRFTSLGGLKRLAKALKVHPMELLRNQ